MSIHSHLKCSSENHFVNIFADYRNVLNNNSLKTALPIKVIFSTCTEFSELFSKYKAVLKCSKPAEK